MYAVENTMGGGQVMILDPGAPMSLAGRPWLERYLAKFDYKIKDRSLQSVIKCFNLGELTRDM